MFGLLWMILGCRFGVFMLFGTMCVAWLLVAYLGCCLRIVCDDFSLRFVLLVVLCSCYLWLV